MMIPLCGEQPCARSFSCCRKPSRLKPPSLKNGNASEVANGVLPRLASAMQAATAMSVSAESRVRPPAARGEVLSPDALDRLLARLPALEAEERDTTDSRGRAEENRYRRVCGDHARKAPAATVCLLPAP